MIVRNLFFILILITCTCNAFAQEEKIEIFDGISLLSIIKQTSDFDKVVLYNSNGYWNYNLVLKGFGCKDDKCRRLVIEYRRDKNKNIVLKKVRRMKLIKEDIMADVMPILGELNNDSLNNQIDPKTNLSLKVSDGETYSLIYFDNLRGIILHKFAYMPQLYHRQLFVKDREDFIKIYNHITLTFNRSQKDGIH